MQAEIEFPDALQFLFEPARYKVAYGGRGGAKSWGVARALLVIGASKPLRVLANPSLQRDACGATELCDIMQSSRHSAVTSVDAIGGVCGG